MADQSVKLPIGVVEDMPVRVGRYFIPIDFVIVEMEEDSHTPLLLGRSFLNTAKAIIDVHGGMISFTIGGDKVVFNVNRSMKYPSNNESIFLVDVGEETMQESINDALVTNPLEEILEDSSCARKDEENNTEVFSAESIPDFAETSETSTDDAPKVELKPLPTNLRYEYLRANSNLTHEQTEKLLKVLKDHRKALGYTIGDLKGISPSICMHRIHMADDHKPTIEGQRRLNPNLSEVVRKEVQKLLDAGFIYRISDSKWVSPVHVVPKKGGTTVVEDNKGALIATRLVTGWRMCIDYRKLNTGTCKDHFPLPFIDQLLERLAKHEYFCYLDGYSGFFQIPIHPDDQEKITFTCPYGTFAYRRMPFGLCNAPATFQRAMMGIFSDLIEKCMEVFMDDFSVYGSAFDECLANLGKVLQRCEEVSLVLNWEKCHFMVQDGVILGH